MDNKEIKEKSIELAKAYIQNSNVILKIVDCESEKNIVKDDCCLKSGNSSNFTFKQIVEYFERQLK